MQTNRRVRIDIIIIIIIIIIRDYLAFRSCFELNKDTVELRAKTIFFIKVKIK